MSELTRLSPALKELHIVSLGLVALTTVFLIAPAAYHRIAENGEDSEQVAEFGSRMVLLSLVPLAIGIASDVVVVVEQAELSRFVALVVSAAFLVSVTTLWAAYPLWRRRQRYRFGDGSIPDLYK